MIHSIRYLATLLFLLTTTLQAESYLIDVVHYRAVLRFDLAQRSVEGDAAVTVRNAARGDLDEITLDLVNIRRSPAGDRASRDAARGRHYYRARAVRRLSRQ
jgi:hypothetical protein